MFVMFDMCICLCSRLLFLFVLCMMPSDVVDLVDEGGLHHEAEDEDEERLQG